MIEIPNLAADVPDEGAYIRRKDGLVIVFCPKCSDPLTLSKQHKVMFVNGELDVGGSIICPCGAHYYIKRGQVEYT